MKCPECKAPIQESNISIYIDPEDDFIEIDVQCDKCEKEFFSRVHEPDLIPCDA